MCCFSDLPDERHGLFTLDEHLGSFPVFRCGSCCSSFLFFGAVLFALFIFDLRLVCPILLVSLDVPSLIALTSLQWPTLTQFSQNCIRRSSLGQRKSGFIRKVTSY